MGEHEKDLLLMKKIVYFTNCPAEKWLVYENQTTYF